MGVKFFDFNNDGLLDLFVTDMHSDMSYDLGYDEADQENGEVDNDVGRFVYGGP